MRDAAHLRGVGSMRDGVALLLLLCLPRARSITVGPDTKPHVNGNRILLDGGVHAWQGPSTDVSSPIQDAETGKRTVIGTLAQMGEEDAIRAVEAAAMAWDRGQGEWPQMPLAGRIERVQAVVAALKERRDEIVNVLITLTLTRTLTRTLILTLAPTLTLTRYSCGRSARVSLMPRRSSTARWNSFRRRSTRSSSWTRRAQAGAQSRG